jgi:hypothetical protein
MTSADVLGRVDEPTDGTGGSVDAVMEMAIDQHREFRPTTSVHVLVRWGSVAGALMLALVTTSGIAGESTQVQDQRRVPAGEQVVTVTLCRGRYDIILKDGGRRQLGEPNLAFKIDTGELNATPAPPSALLVPSRHHPDRAFVIFPSLEALKAGLKSGC